MKDKQAHVQSGAQNGSYAMRGIRVEKIVMNVGCGIKLNIEHAKLVLESISGSKAVITKTKKRSTFNVPKNKPIGCKVTVRKGVAVFLKRLLEAKEGKLRAENFDDSGNFAFGIKEYIDIPGMEYEPKIGMIGLDVCVSLDRPGYSVKRKRLSKRIGKNHRITREEAMDFAKKSFNVEIE